MDGRCRWRADLSGAGTRQVGTLALAGSGEPAGEWSVRWQDAFSPARPTPRWTRYYAAKTILITGASSGIGAAMARQLAPMGTTLVLTARSEEALGALAREVRGSGSTAHVVPLDLATPGAAERLIASVDALGLTVDVLIANAGYGHTGPFEAQDADDLDAMLGLNVVALTALIRRLGTRIPRGGGVLTVASTAAFQPLPYFAAYAATKAYVLSLSEALHAEWKDRGVAVTCLCPGPTATGFGARASMSASFFSAAASADDVARDGLAALARGRRTTISGALNAVGASVGRLVPRRVLLPLIAKGMRKLGQRA